MVNLTRSELCRIWKYLIEKLNKSEQKIQTLQEQNKAQLEEIVRLRQIKSSMSDVVDLKTQEIKKLKADREVLVECVRFYADKENWTGFEDFSKEKANMVLATSRCVFKKDNEYDGPHDYSFTCGKTARQALKSIGEIE